MRVAAVDCGTNTLRLLVASTEPWSVRVRESRIVRLGEGVDRTGRLSAAGLGRAGAALAAYAEMIAAHHVDRVRVCATSATRDAANAADFADLVRSTLGVEPEVLSGSEEALLAYAGATASLPADVAAPVLVVDVGGGSTELALGGGPAGLPGLPGPAVCSMDVGAVRLHERHLRSDPPTPAEVAACVADVSRALDGAPVDPAAAATVVGEAGTVTSVAGGARGLSAYDAAAVASLDGAVLPVADVLAVADRLVAMPLAERQALPWLDPGRADVIGAGALIWATVLRRSSVTTCRVSEADLLDGIARGLAGSGVG